MKVVYPGSFDPITCGHLDIIERASQQFDELLVAVLENRQKVGLFTIPERIEMIRESVKAFPNVSVIAFSGLLVDCALNENARGIIRGLRAISDYEYEMQMALVNKELCPELETFFMVSKGEFAYLSSSIVKEIASFGGDYQSFVPAHVYKKLQQKTGGM